MFKQLLCAVDFAPSSVGVIRQALSLAWETHGHVTFVCVMTEPSPSLSEIRTQLLAAIPPEAHDWCDIELVVKPGVPATEIVRAAETSNVDILLIGPPRQWTSTTQAVLAKSVCPVLVTHDARPLPYPPGKLASAASAPLECSQEQPSNGRIECRARDSAVGICALGDPVGAAHSHRELRRSVHVKFEPGAVHAEEAKDCKVGRDLGRCLGQSSK